jgi:IS30 family transposase
LYSREALQKQGPQKIPTNNKALAKHPKIVNQLDANTYLARPYTPQDKGTAENRIWVLAQGCRPEKDFRRACPNRREVPELSAYLKI